MHKSLVRCTACRHLFTDTGQSVCIDCGGTLVIIRMDTDNGRNAMVTIMDVEPIPAGRERFEVKATLVFDVPAIESVDPDHMAHEIADAVTARLADEAGYVGKEGYPLTPLRLRVSAIKQP